VCVCVCVCVVICHNLKVTDKRKGSEVNDHIQHLKEERKKDKEDIKRQM